MHQIFLSHATRDAALVGELKIRLQAIGVTVYLAEYDGRAGEDVHAKIAKELDRSSAVIVLLTDAGYSSLYVHQEIGWAKSKNKMVVPVVTNAAAAGGLGMLEGLEYIPFDEDNPAQALDKLDDRVATLLRQWKQRDDIQTAVLVAGVVALLYLMSE